jgi:elongation factor Ts
MGTVTNMEDTLEISATAVKELRQRTGVGVMDCRRALEAAGGDLNKATELLRERGMAIAEKKASRTASQGVIDCYIHAGGRIGVLVELNCETDFVARNEEFRALAHDIAMQVAATNPQYLSPDDVPAEESDQKEELALLSQPFIKDASTNIQKLIIEKIAKFGENVKLRRYVRYALGGD